MERAGEFQLEKARKTGALKEMSHTICIQAPLT